MSPIREHRKVRIVRETIGKLLIRYYYMITRFDIEECEQLSGSAEILAEVFPAKVFKLMLGSA